MKMKMRIMPFCFCFLFLASVLFGQDKAVTEIDGTDWNGHDRSYKVGYICGFLSGIDVYYSELNTIKYVKERKDQYDTLYNTVKITREKLSIFGITVGQITDGLDSIYKDFSNRRIKVVDAIYIAKMMINGSNKDLIDCQIRFLRMQPIDENKSDAAFKRILDYISMINTDLNKNIASGKVSKEDFLIIGFFVSETGDQYPLFRYGYYK